MKKDISEIEFSDELRPISPYASIKFALRTTSQYPFLLFQKLEDIENSLFAIQNLNQNQEIAKLTELLRHANSRLEAKEVSLSSIPQWHEVSAIAVVKGLSADAIRKQLKNGEFEEGKDFKYNGSKILIYQGAVERIHRRRSSNG